MVRKERISDSKAVPQTLTKRHRRRGEMRGMYYPMPVRKSAKRGLGPKLHCGTDTG